jgi:hypothetical protein
MLQSMQHHSDAALLPCACILQRHEQHKLLRLSQCVALQPYCSPLSCASWAAERKIAAALQHRISDAAPAALVVVVVTLLRMLLLKVHQLVTHICKHAAEVDD